MYGQGNEHLNMTLNSKFIPRPWMLFNCLNSLFVYLGTNRLFVWVRNVQEATVTTCMGARRIAPKRFAPSLEFVNIYIFWTV